MSGRNPPQPTVFKNLMADVKRSNRSGKRKARATPSTASSHRDNSSESYPASTSGKVAIPRLFNEDPLGLSSKPREPGKVDRTNHACEPCRGRKTKCSGERPVCKHCRQFNIACLYADGKRDRAKRQQEELERRVDLYESLLTEAGPDLPPGIWARFESARSRNEDAESLDLDVKHGEREEEEEEEDSPPVRGEDVRAASEGSIDAIDFVEENLTKSVDAQAVGFVGKASEVDWQKKLNKKENTAELRAGIKDLTRESFQAGPSTLSMSTQAQHTSIPYAADPDLSLYDVPPVHIAKHLSSVFFHRVYPSFPVLPQLNFETQLEKAYSTNFELEGKPNDQWRGIMNTVFAIGARYLELTGNFLAAYPEDHEVFFARAIGLSLHMELLTKVNDLQQVQVRALGAFYLLSIDHTNNAWMMAGHAVRAAIALGLQVEIKSTDLSERGKESRYRLWWAVYGLEISLAVMTGRPSSISLYAFSTPLPLPYDERVLARPSTDPLSVNTARFTQTSYRGGPATDGRGAPNLTKDPPGSTVFPQNQVRAQALRNVSMSNSLYLIFRIRLHLILHEVLETLYQPAAAHHLWSQVQAGIHRFNVILDNWYASLPAILDFEMSHDDQWVTCRNLLAVLFYQIRVLINRPCLCEMTETTPHETTASQEFNSKAACRCVEAALQTLRLLPRSGPTSAWAETGPWWAMTHYTFSAVTILSITLFYECEHIGKDEQPTVIEHARHGLYWLHALAQEPNEGAQRAWQIASTTLARIDQRLGFDAFGSDPIADNFRSADPTTHHSGPHASDMASQEFQPYGLSETTTTTNTQAYTDWENSANLERSFGHLFSSYAAPSGFPMAYQHPAAGYALAGDEMLSSPTSYCSPQLKENFMMNQMPQQPLDPNLGVHGGMPMPPADAYPDITMDVAEQQGAPSWTMANDAHMASDSGVPKDHMDYSYSHMQRQRPP